jgi:hypothetical protein
VAGLHQQAPVAEWRSRTSRNGGRAAPNKSGQRIIPARFDMHPTNRVGTPGGHFRRERVADVPQSTA